nr:ABC-three component system protein [uncultured Bdellovibrio sp.]
MRQVFKVKALKADGQAFEDLFTSVMGHHNPNFTQIKPYGREGDHKNDGFDRTTGTFYQCYGPEDLEKREANALTKLETDFNGLKEKWNDETPIQEFHYVLNDKYKGVPPTLEHALAGIKTTHGLNQCKPLLPKDLEEMLFSLSDDKVYDVIGGVPGMPSNEAIQLAALNEVVHFLIQNMDVVSFKGKLVSPDFEDKIQFNGLGELTAAILRDGSYQVHVLEKYFGANAASLREDLRQIFNKIYKESIDIVKETEELNKPDVIFLHIAESAFPNQKKMHRDSIYVLMSYYFEACDIFEEPTKVGAK